MSKRVFKAFCRDSRISVSKLGVDGTEKFKPYELPPLLRYAPDFFCTLPSGKPICVELKGCKNEGLRLKSGNLESYQEWNKLLDTFAFVYNSQLNSHAFLPLSELAEIAKHVGTTIDPDMGEIYLIPCEMLEWSSKPISHKTQYADNYTN